MRVDVSNSRRISVIFACASVGVIASAPAGAYLARALPACPFVVGFNYHRMHTRIAASRGLRLAFFRPEHRTDVSCGADYYFPTARLSPPTLALVVVALEVSW